MKFVSGKGAGGNFPVQVWLERTTSEHLKLTLYAVACLWLSLALASCVALKTTFAPESSATMEPRLGNYYFLPRGLIQLDGVPGTNDFQLTVKTFNVPDKNRRFFLRQHKNPFYEDDVLLKINGKGLLETVNLSTEDKTPAIIDKVTDIFIDVARISASGGISPLARNADEIENAIPLKPFHVVFDPFIPAQKEAAVRTLHDCGFVLAVPDSRPAQYNIPGDSKATSLITEQSSQAAPNPGNAEGILFRPPTAIELQISTRDNSEAGLLQHVFIRLPSLNEIAVMDASRSFLIKKKNNYVLVDGDLIQIDHNRPSQALAFVSIPASILHKVAEAIPTIIAIEDKRATRVPPELAAQKAQLDAQTALLNSQMALIEARRKAQGDGQTNRALTRDALANQARAEDREASARLERAKADKEEAEARAEKAKAEKAEATVRAQKAPTRETPTPTP